jgi:tRNA-Thr(GGU) m(6)t(6)A37 methyltransferase TsaA
MECVIIGSVKSPITKPMDMRWGEVISEIVVKPEYIKGLLGLDEFTHLMILTFLHEAEYVPEKHLRRHPQERKDLPLVGIFAQRARHRPNKIGVTTVEVVKVTNNRLKVRGLDAIDGTPVLDIKPYVPIYDKRNARIPDWMEKMMNGYF